jgi:hypothetical protein
MGIRSAGLIVDSPGRAPSLAQDGGHFPSANSRGGGRIHGGHAPTMQCTFFHQAMIIIILKMSFISDLARH